MYTQCCLTRSKEPVPHLGETLTRMPHIRAPCLGLDETGHTRLTQIPHDRQAHPGPPRLHRSGKAIGTGDKLSGKPKLPQMPGSSRITGELPGPGTIQTTGTHGNSEVIY